MRQVDDLPMLRYQKEPVAAPGDIADHRADPRNLHHDFRMRAVTHHVGHADAAIGPQFRLDRAHRCVDFKGAGSNLAGELERGDQADRTVPAHPQVADVIEVDDAKCTVVAMRFDEQRADQGVRAPRLIHDGTTVVVEVLAKTLRTLRQRPVPQVRAALEHQARGFTAGVRIDDAD